MTAGPGVPSLLRAAGSDAVRAMRRARLERRRRPSVEEVGTVLSVAEGVARVAGLSGAGVEEVLRFRAGALGVAFDLASEEVGVVLLDHPETVEAGGEVRRTGRMFGVPVGEALLGRVVGGDGRPLDEKGPVAAGRWRAAEGPAPPITDRAPVSVPLQTGVKAVDALVPVGRGQRELIMGDRGTGKTALAVEAMLNQGDGDVLCVYCSVSQRDTAVARVLDRLRGGGAMERTAVVAASGDDPPGLQFLAPYTAMAMAESFMEEGRDVLLVLDDLTRHARAYRELSLLLRRPPGREAYPGDIFYVHARLLERATRLTEAAGGGSVTALPVVETQAQNLSAYIPTNLISITDGQIYLNPALHQKGILPAVDMARSVSRVGGQAQLPAYRSVAGPLRLSYSQFLELEVFARFATQLDEETRRALERGRRVREVLRQPLGEHLRPAEQIAVLLAVTRGLLDTVPPRDVEEAARSVRSSVVDRLPAICARIEAGEPLDEEDREAILEAARASLEGAPGAEG